jgi:hypothetical protein
LKALTSGSFDFSNHGLVAVAANPSTDFFNEICQNQTFSKYRQRTRLPLDRNRLGNRCDAASPIDIGIRVLFGRPMGKGRLVLQENFCHRSEASVKEVGRSSTSPSNQCSMERAMESLRLRIVREDLQGIGAGAAVIAWAKDFWLTGFCPS